MRIPNEPNYGTEGSYPRGDGLIVILEYYETMAARRRPISGYSGTVRPLAQTPATTSEKKPKTLPPFHMTSLFLLQQRRQRIKNCHLST